MTFNLWVLFSSLVNPFACEAVHRQQLRPLICI
jgi:hypothetical protein